MTLLLRASTRRQHFYSTDAHGQNVDIMRGSTITEISSDARQVWEGKPPTSFWKTRANRIAYFQWLGKRLGYTNINDWYKLTRALIHANKGATLYRSVYNCSTILVLKDIFPDHEWQPWKLAKVPMSWWSDLENQRKYLDYMGTHELGVKKLEDWYSIPASKIIALGGSRVVRDIYKASMPSVMRSVYPEHPWEIFKFGIVPTGYWDDLSNQREYMDWLGKKLGCDVDMSRWYTVSAEEAIDVAKSHKLIRKRYGNVMANALMTIYPDHTWDPHRFVHARPNNVNDEEQESEPTPPT